MIYQQCKCGVFYAPSRAGGKSHALLRSPTSQPLRVREASLLGSVVDGPQRRCRRRRPRDFVNLAESTIVGGSNLSSGRLGSGQTQGKLTKRDASAGSPHDPAAAGAPDVARCKDFLHGMAPPDGVHEVFYGTWPNGSNFSAAYLRIFRHGAVCATWACMQDRQPRNYIVMASRARQRRPSADTQVSAFI